MPRLISLYIFRELTTPFFLALVVLTATAFLSKAVKLVELLLTGGPGFKFVFLFILSVIPSFLIYTIPISFLIAVLVGFTRLSSDSEITAMKASGLSLFTMMRPVIALAFISYAVTLIFTLYLFPWGNITVKRLLLEGAGKSLTAGIEEKTFYDGFKGVTLYVDHVSRKTGELEGVFISEKGPGGKTDVFSADRGIIGATPEKYSMYLRLEDGAVHRLDQKKDTYHIAEFSTYVVELSLTGAASGGVVNKSNRELYPAEMSRKIQSIRARGGVTAPYVIDLHKRFALPASIFIFALIGVPLGMQRIRSARFTGFSVALGVVLVYYVISTALEGMGENGVINPIFSVWGSDIIMGIAGVYLFYMAARDRRLNIFSRAGRKRKT